MVDTDWDGNPSGVVGTCRQECQEGRVDKVIGGTVRAPQNVLPTAGLRLVAICGQAKPLVVELDRPNSWLTVVGFHRAVPSSGLLGRPEEWDPSSSFHEANSLRDVAVGHLSLSVVPLCCSPQS
mmetsp:Transcript_28394/g.43725  ORF Transcript_28394/g.43725 Transcript_28394/m.43725 type:complete len:124 (-) Transcript_28394:110-481(-)